MGHRDTVTPISHLLPSNHLDLDRSTIRDTVFFQNTKETIRIPVFTASSRFPRRLASKSDSDEAKRRENAKRENRMRSLHRGPSPVGYTINSKGVGLETRRDNSLDVFLPRCCTASKSRALPVPFRANRLSRGGGRASHDREGSSAIVDVDRAVMNAREASGEEIITKWPR